MIPSRQTFLLAALFFTAFSSLIYELVWTRKLSHLFGTSALAESTVLAMFMGGLALGSLFGGRLLARARNPFRFLALLELLIGGSCLVALFTFAGLHRYYLPLLDATGGGWFFNVALFAITGGILIVPTFLIGAAFPTIVELYHYQRHAVGRSVGSCYLVDTVGGALGLLVAAFYLVAQVGFLKVSLIASAINLLIGLFVLVLFRDVAAEDVTVEDDEAEAEAGATPPVPGDRARLVPILFFLTGFAALCFELIWIRHISLIYGGSLYSFAIVVVSFLIGLGLGGLFYNVALDRVQNKVSVFVGLCLAIGASGLVLTGILPRLEPLFLRIYYRADSYESFVLALSLICVGLLIVPTMLMGATLPVLSAIHARGRQIATPVGALFAVNSFGALCGSFCTGFLIIPALGIKHSAFVAAAIYAVVALTFLFAFTEERRAIVRTALVSGLVLTTAVALYFVARPARHLYNGAFYLGTVYDNYIENYLANQAYAYDNLVFLEHSPYGQVAVFGHNENSMYITSNGKIEASSEPAGRVAHNMLADIPLLLHDDPQDVLTIGLGGGWTLTEILKHDVRSAEVAEINDAVVRANAGVLSPFNGDPLTHDRAHVIVGDGRNYLANTTRRYDVIISEPPEIWVGGVSSLFTREFYSIARRALRDGGLFCQWIPRYEMSLADYQIALNTLRQEFPYLYEFDMVELNRVEAFRELVIVASTTPVDIEGRFGTRRFDLALSDGPSRDYMLEMLGHAEISYQRGHESTAETADRALTINTDDLPILEFRTLRNRFRRFKAE